jgi:hypothetical protein
MSCITTALVKAVALKKAFAVNKALPAVNRL